MQRIAVLGGGLMGAGIAQVFVANGYEVNVFEPDAEARTSLKRRVAEGLRAIGPDASGSALIRACDTLAEAVDRADFVTEAAPEKLELKRTLFAEMVQHAPAEAILASNSSVIPVTRIVAGLPTSHRMVGTHWWNPAPLIPLVEVISGEATSAQTVEATMELLRAVGKLPAHILRDVPGFVANRLQHALWREAIAMVAEGICDARSLDDCVKNSFGLRLAVLGPLENADLVGLDLTLDIHNTIIPELDRHAGPHEFLEARVSQGKLGFKTGEGFRAWTVEDQDALRSRLTSHLLKAQKERQ